MIRRPPRSTHVPYTTPFRSACNTYTWSTGDGKTYTTSGNYDYITQGANGCADTVTLKLTINQGTHTTETQAACGSYTWSKDGKTYTASGNYDYITHGANGCTETVTLKL